MMRTLLGIALVALVFGCGPTPAPNAGGPNGGGETPSAPAGQKPRIAVIPKGTTHEFWKSVHYGAQLAAEKYGLEIVWLGPQLENDREGQIRVVQNFTTQRVDGIVLAPLDSQALVAPVKSASRAGIPVVIFDSDLDDSSIIVSYVATDNKAGGRLAAEEMAKRLGGKGNVVMLRYNPGSASTQLREEGFLEKLKEYPDIKVISSEQYAGTTPESSLQKAQQVLQTHRDEINGIFAVCEPNAAGTLRALEDSKLIDKVVFVGFDPNPTMVKALADGKMKGIVLQDPVRMGYLAVEAMARKLKGETVEARIPTGEHLATPENMNSEEMKKLLAPPQFGE